VKSDAVSRLRRFTVWHAALLLPWAVSAYAFARTFNDNSYLWHVRAGDLQLERGAVLTTDPFSFTMQGEPWRTQSWLAELLYSVADRWAGLDASPFMTFACAVTLFLLAGLFAYRLNRSLLSTVVFLVGTSVVFAGFLNPRPVIFSFPIFAAVVVADHDRRLRWSLPLLMWLWAAVHGSFVIGLGYLGMQAIRRGFDARRIGGLVMAGLPTLLTAHGIGIIDILLAFSLNKGAVDSMTEWGTPDLLSVPFIPVFLGLVGLVYLAHRGGMPARFGWILVPFVALALSANRAVPPAWLGLSPLLGRITVPLRASLRGRMAALLLGAVLLIGPLLLQSDEEIDTSRFPIEAAEHLTAERVFHDDATGGWLIYTQWPQRQVYIDDRAELFGDQMLTFIKTRAGFDLWSEELAKWDIEQALVRVDVPLAETLRLAGWRVAYEDEDFVVLNRPDF